MRKLKILLHYWACEICVALAFIFGLLCIGNGFLDMRDGAGVFMVSSDFVMAYGAFMYMLYVAATGRVSIKL